MSQISWNLAWWKPNFAQDHKCLPFTFIFRFCVRNLNIMLLEIHEFNEKGHREGHTFYYDCKWNYVYMRTIIFPSITDLGVGTWCNYDCSCKGNCQNGQGTTYIPNTHCFHSFFSQEQLFWEYCGLWLRILNC